MIRWPDRYAPSRAPVHVSNEIDAAAPPESVWAWLIDVERWPTWYPNASNVVFADGAAQLSLRIAFKWRTFGVAIRSTVVEFESYDRIAWNAFGLGVDAYHAWLLTATPRGTHILTEETQYGWAARLGSVLFPNRMSNGHQMWLEQLSEKAGGGPPPRA